MKTDSLPEIFVSRQEAARTGSLLENCLLQKKLDTTATSCHLALIGAAWTA